MKSLRIPSFIALLGPMFDGGQTRPIEISPLRLAISPQCGTLTSSSFNNFNTGINLKRIKTVYAFGDSWMANGQSKGAPGPPAVRNEKDPHDTRYGLRISNGLVWPEQFANNIGAVLKDYAQAGATVSNELWPTDKTQSDMIDHVQLFLDQHNQIDGSSTIAVVSYGINDWGQTRQQGTENLPKAAQELIRQTDRIIKAGIQNIVVLSPPNIPEPLRNFNNIIWNGLKDLKTQNPTFQFGYVDFSQLYSAITANPQSFGYQSTDACLKSPDTLVGACPNPDVYLYYAPGHPQKLTHGLMANWAFDVLSGCTS